MKRCATLAAGGIFSAALAAAAAAQTAGAATDLVLERIGSAPVRLSPHLVPQAFLGLETVDLTPELRRHLGAPADRGVLVAHVRAGSPAAAAGLEVGDLLLAAGAESIRSSWDLAQEVRLCAPGATLVLEASRGGEAVRAPVELGEIVRPTFDLGPVVWRLHEERGPRRLVLRRPGGEEELVVDGERVDELASRLADRLAGPQWRELLEGPELAARIAELERRLAELEAELERLRAEP